MKCDICDTTKNNFWVNYSECSKQELRNFEAEFATWRGKTKNDKDNFEFCEKCHSVFKDWKADEVVKELATKNLANSGQIPVSWLSKTNYLTNGKNHKNDIWEKVQRAITDNIKIHCQEWEIKELKQRWEILFWR